LLVLIEVYDGGKPMNSSSQENDPGAERWTLIRDIGVLQVKLLVDGFRDLILVPASLIAGIISLTSMKEGRVGLQFYHLMAWGRQSEHWINLFGALNNAPEKIEDPLSPGNQDIDDIVGRLEAFVVEEVKRGGVTSQAKDRLDKILDALQRKKNRS
jgi:hypothetical protein